VSGVRLRIVGCRTDAYLRPVVLLELHHPRSLAELRHEEAESEATRRDLVGSGEL
jgi:hypothetical protein